MKLIPETLDGVSWNGKPVKELTREELESAFLGTLQLCIYEMGTNRERLDELELQWNKEIEKWRNDNKRKSFDNPWWKRLFE